MSVRPRAVIGSCLFVLVLLSACKVTRRGSSSRHADVTNELRQAYEAKGVIVSGATCPAEAARATTFTCTLTSVGKIPILVTVDGEDVHFEPQNAALLDVSRLEEALRADMSSRGRDAHLECGRGSALLATIGADLSCEATLTDGRKLPVRVTPSDPSGNVHFSYDLDSAPSVATAKPSPASADNRGGAPSNNNTAANTNAANNGGGGGCGVLAPSQDACGKCGYERCCAQGVACNGDATCASCVARGFQGQLDATCKANPRYQAIHGCINGPCSSACNSGGGGNTSGGGKKSCNTTTCVAGPAGDQKCRAQGCGPCGFGFCNVF